MCLSHLCLPSGAFALDTVSLAEKAMPSVVLLTVYNAADQPISHGTGFFASEDGRILTNSHVIAGASTVTATLSDGTEVEVVGLLATDELADLAVLQADGGNFPKLALADDAAARPGVQIVVIGSPRGLSNTVTTGIISAVRKEGVGDLGGNGAWGIQVSAAISPGSSGSPILLESGEVVAVAVGKLHGAENVNFGIPAGRARDLLAGIEAGAKPKAFPRAGSSVLENLAWSAAFFGAIGLIGWIVGRILARKKRKPGGAS